jgi:hypothetical protein
MNVLLTKYNKMKITDISNTLDSIINIDDLSSYKFNINDDFNVLKIDISNIDLFNKNYMPKIFKGTDLDSQKNFLFFILRNSILGFYTIGLNELESFDETKITPTIYKNPTASSISYGTDLSSSILKDGSSSVVGTFNWEDPKTIPKTGTKSYPIIFSPTDLTKYNTISGEVELTVTKSIPIIYKYPNASNIYAYQDLNTSILSTDGSASVVGKFNWENPSFKPFEGTTRYQILFSPTDSINYNTISGLIELTVDHKDIDTKTLNDIIKKITLKKLPENYTNKNKTIDLIFPKSLLNDNFISLLIDKFAKDIDNDTKLRIKYYLKNIKKGLTNVASEDKKTINTMHFIIQFSILVSIVNEIPTEISKNNKDIFIANLMDNFIIDFFSSIDNNNNIYKSSDGYYKFGIENKIIPSSNNEKDVLGNLGCPQIVGDCLKKDPSGNYIKDASGNYSCNPCPPCQTCPSLTHLENKCVDKDTQGNYSCISSGLATAFTIIGIIIITLLVVLICVYVYNSVKKPAADPVASAGAE